jgi:ADP-L-glycero-D-manno-heptose 6-epimerase
MGAISSTTEKDVRRFYEYNVDYTIRLLEKCIEHSVAISYASSASVYGNLRGGINPLNQYALSKATVDMWVEDHSTEFTNFVRGYRFFNVYGEGEDHKGDQASPIHKFVKQAKEAGKIEIFDEDGDGCRDFIWVGDVCRILVDDERDSGIYDLGTCNPLLFSEVAEMVAEKFDAEVVQIPFPEHLQNKYQYHTCADQTDARNKWVKDYIDGL